MLHSNPHDNTQFVASIGSSGSVYSSRTATVILFFFNCGFGLLPVFKYSIDFVLKANSRLSSFLEKTKPRMDSQSRGCTHRAPTIFKNFEVSNYTTGNEIASSRTRLPLRICPYLMLTPVVLPCPPDTARAEPQS
mmetsp:Transcript_3700/g.5383  ORF Transcript_3700/g.5383 Transcript_3700/m.5383 type:complete len:135 (-) Transcript_3700:204-608(-)